MTLTTILWDAGGVIYSFDQKKCDTRLAAACGRTPEDVSKMLFGSSAEGREYNAGLVEKFNLGKINELEFYYGVKETLGLSINYEQFVSAWTDIFTPNLEVMDLMKLFADIRIKQAILSSTNPLHWQTMNTLFDLETLLGQENIVCTYHSGVGVKKGKPQLFDIVLGRIKKSKEEVVYVDDVKKYVDSAAEYGFGATVHVDIEQRDFQEKCIRKLQKLGFRL